jgi:hypothetical protein
LIGAGNAARNFRAVKIHPDPLLAVVDVNVGRGDVSSEPGFLKRQHAGFMRSPGAFEPVGIGETNVVAVVVGEVQIVVPERVSHPPGHADQ